MERPEINYARRITVSILLISTAYCNTVFGTMIRWLDSTWREPYLEVVRVVAAAEPGRGLCVSVSPGIGVVAAAATSTCKEMHRLNKNRSQTWAPSIFFGWSPPFPSSLKKFFPPHLTSSPKRLDGNFFPSPFPSLLFLPYARSMFFWQKLATHFSLSRVYARDPLLKRAHAWAGIFETFLYWHCMRTSGTNWGNNSGSNSGTEFCQLNKGSWFWARASDELRSADDLELESVLEHIIWISNLTPESGRRRRPVQHWERAARLRHNGRDQHQGLGVHFHSRNKIMKYLIHLYFSGINTGWTPCT